ncbi:MAG: hypothetical protein LBJ68_01445 [Endomicrobium sp.]|nr:hypothetical protein [Endomicrobium sp.]
MVILLILILNKGNRVLLENFFSQYKLKKNIKNACRQNDLFKKRIYYLEKEPIYLEKMVRSELDVTAQYEIEYRFNI